MGTTSTVPVVFGGVLTSLTARGLAAFESWPGPGAAREMVVLGETTWDDYEIATIKAGRKHRQESYGIGFEVFVMGAEDTSPADPSAARDRAFDLLAEIEDFLAEDVTAGLDFATVQHVQVRPDTASPRVFEKGWAFRVAGSIRVEARLT